MMVCWRRQWNICASFLRAHLHQTFCKCWLCICERAHVLHVERLRFSILHLCFKGSLVAGLERSQLNPWRAASSQRRQCKASWTNGLTPCTAASYAIAVPIGDACLFGISLQAGLTVYCLPKNNHWDKLTCTVAMPTLMLTVWSSPIPYHICSLRHVFCSFSWRNMGNTMCWDRHALLVYITVFGCTLTHPAWHIGIFCHWLPVEECASPARISFKQSFPRKGPSVENWIWTSKLIIRRKRVVLCKWWFHESV